MKYLPITLTLLFGLVSADAQVSSGSGIFGFGRKKEQINAGLFPDANLTQPVQVSAPVSSRPPAPQATAPAPPPRTSDNIFRGGAPQEIDAVSYVIEDGQKVEKAAKPKKVGFFGFGKKGESKTPESTPVLEPIPATSYPDPNEARADLTPEPAAPSPPIVPEVIQPEGDASLNLATETIPEIVDSSPVVDDAKEKKSGMFSFFNRKSKQEKPAPVIQPQPVVVNDPAPIEVIAPAPAPAPAPAQATPTEPTPVSTDTPSFAGVQTPKKEKSGFSLPNPLKNLKPPSNPIKNLRPPKKEKTIDLTGAETIISNGEIVDGQEDIVESNIVTGETGTREPPRIVNGVKTYSSWDDVGGSSVSAADKILNQIR